ncbi:MAG: HAMP domain-containing protein [Planctomycetaceae bacterium]|jgi:signal transduction histidine kinase|nr:HAMP domain-containing protein [Planctomycetaceae bacterium]
MSNRSSVSIRKKIQLVLGLLLLLLFILAGTGILAALFYRDSALLISRRSSELPLAVALSQQISQMQRQAESLRESQKEREAFLNRYRFTFDISSLAINKEILGQNQKQSFVLNLQTLRRLEQDCCRALYNGQENRPENRLPEQQILHEIAVVLDDIELRGNDPSKLNDVATLQWLGEKLDEISFHSRKFLDRQQTQLSDYAENIKSQYRLFLGIVATSAVVSAAILFALLRLMFAGIFYPLQVLVSGAQMVAQGRFNYRIKLNAKDEMAQLADAFNQMTERFETIRNDLDAQVQTKSRELVRTERLASVGFLAAGVAHEINNPLASIAMSAESLQRRILPILEQIQKYQNANPPTETPQNFDGGVIERYLAMIQEEAFRCKGITEKLLDFARAERKIRERTNLSELISGIVEMLNHLGKYKEKHIRLEIPPTLYALVNPQEMKQVALNLLTNALDSVDDGGVVWVRLFEKEEIVHLIFEDNGCGMDADVLQNVFEPFFTKRKNGQGTGLGLSITHRIISEHQGRIEAYSAGLGLGAVFQVEIPVASPESEKLAAMKSKEIATMRNDLLRNKFLAETKEKNNKKN